MATGTLSMDYRVYLLGPDGRIAGRLDIVSADDDTAKERARLLAEDCAVELWQGDRKIADYPGSRQPTRP